MKTYEGIIAAEGPAAFIIEGDRRRPLPLRLDLRQHSPDGFAWGYHGSGPAQLALALCADVLQDDERAQRVYQPFKARVVAGLRGDRWTLTEDEIRATVEQLEREHQLEPGRDREQPQPEQPTEGGRPAITPEQRRAAAEAISAALKAQGFSDYEQRMAAVVGQFRRHFHACNEAETREDASRALEGMNDAFCRAVSLLAYEWSVDAERVVACCDAVDAAALEQVRRLRAAA